MMKKVKSGSADSIIYPQTAYLAYILVIRNKTQRFFLPFNEIFTEIGQIKSYTQLYIEQSSDEETFIPPAPVVFPIGLAEKVPLKSEYWESPTDELTRTDRINNFLRPLENYHFQKLLITPFKNKGKTILTATYCFSIQAKMAEIDFFMSTFFLSLDEKARYAAIYHFENPFRYELDTDEKIKIEESPPSILH